MNKQALINQIEADATKKGISTKYVKTLYKTAKMDYLYQLSLAINMDDYILLLIYREFKIMYPDFIARNNMSEKTLLKEAQNRYWLLGISQGIKY